MPTHVTLGPLYLNSYTFWIGLFSLLGVAWSVWRSGPSRQDRIRVVDGWLLVGVCALVIGRAGYIALHAAYFAERPSEITFAPAPGISEHAAIVGGLIGWLLAKRRKQPPPFHWIVLASLIGIAASIGCVSNACAYGREVFWTDGVAWQIAVDWPDAYRINNPRLPTQVFMAVWSLVCGMAAVLAARRPPNTAPLPAWWVLLFCAGDFVIQFARADATSAFFGLRIEQGLDVVLFVLMAVVLAVNWSRTRAARSSCK